MEISKLETAEKELKKFAGVEIESLRIYIDSSEKNSIFCLKCGDKTNPALVLVHGYLGTSIIFYKILKRLSECYMVYCLDLMGMGRSSRPKYSFRGKEEAESFFIEPLENCRIALGIEKMVLVGHSFGGYVCGCYTEKHPDRVEALILMSTIGITCPPKGQTPKECMKAQLSIIRFFDKINRYFLKKKITITSILRNLGPFSSSVVKKYLKKRWKNVPKEEINHLGVYLESVNLYPGSGEYAAIELLAEGWYAFDPLYKRITNTPTVFIYGDQDWMDPEGSTMNAEYNSCKVIREFISNSGHHMYIDNPVELVEKMIESLNKIRCS